MTADDERNEVLNVGGTRHAVELANELEAGRLHHVSSVAAAGLYKGMFREDMFDEGQKLPSAYHRTKFESEKLAREQSKVPWRVYRPAVVVGHSQTGEMDKIDGPYYFFKAIQKLRHWLPEWVPLVGPELGHTNIVPVDFVARALDHIAHQPGLDGQAFHLTNPKSQRSGEVLNEFAKAAHAPQLALRIDKRLTDALPKGVFSMLLKLPAGQGHPPHACWPTSESPRRSSSTSGSASAFDTRDTERALKGSGIEVPELSSYAGQLWDYWERNLDPDLFKDRSLRARRQRPHGDHHRRLVGHRPGGGAEDRRRRRHPAARRARRGEARGDQEQIESDGRHAPTSTRRTCPTWTRSRTCWRAILADHPAVDMLVNNAGRSIRRSVAQSYDRFHDYERTIQLNYLGAIKMIIGLLPHMRERGFGHIVNVSSIGVQTNPPRFSAYVASKAALDAFTRVVGSEVVGDGVTFTTIHMPLVRTPMIAPTKIYDSFPTISPEEAADLICEALRAKPKTINTRLGTSGEVAYTLAPKAVDQILHMAYKVFPDSAASKGDKEGRRREGFGRADRDGQPDEGRALVRAAGLAARAGSTG